MSKIDVYDFDGTLYNGNSSIDFLIYSIKKNKKTLLFIPKIFIFFLLKLIGIVNTKKFKEVYFEFIKVFNNIDDHINNFWNVYDKKVNKNLIDNLRDNVVNYVISASPEFLLSPYLSKYKNLNLIATKINKKGKIIGENCKGEEKVKLLKKLESDFIIENFYTDSTSDMPLVELSKKSYYVQKDNIESFNYEKVKNKSNKKISKILFIIFLIFYFVLGMQLSFNFDFTNNFDLLFNADSMRVISDMTSIFSDHSRLLVHPLFVLLSQPIYFIISGFTQDKMIALILISSTISALSVMFMYKIISLFSNNNKINFLLSICYGLTFSNLVFTAGIELYNLATFILILLWYFILTKLKNDWSKNDNLIFIALGILTLSITITNYVIFLIGCFILLISKKVNIKKLFKLNIIIVIAFLSINCFQNFIWKNTPMVTNILSVGNSEKTYMDLSLNINNFKNVMKGDIFNSILSSNLQVGKNEFNNPMIVFGNINWFNIIIISIFLLYMFIFTIKNFKKNLYINLGIILSLTFNFLLHLIYGNSSCFLYSLHFLYLLFILFGINCINEDKISIRKSNLILLIILILSEILINSIGFLNILKISSRYLKSNFYIAHFGLLKTIIISFITIILIITFLNLIYYFIKKININMESSNKIKYIIYIFTLILLLESLFVSYQTFPKYIENLQIEMQNSPKNIKINENYKLFKSKFNNEVSSYLSYVNEYKQFIEKYKCSLYHDMPDIEFYFFGMGNRRKILFIDNKLIDIETKEVIEKFDVESYLIIPNEYTVLIKDKNKKYIKIFENNEGVFILKDGKENLIEKTNSYLNIYNFDNQKYKNIKKVLYSEILFNIKDSKIYPNILVYNEPWYRDAAMASMVLKQTNNTELISNWVENIDSIYDEQNAGNKEADNLGELLYIISTQENKNEELISKIEQEAERLATNNPNGYYIFGKTDFSDQHKYQNMWYEFGIKKVGREFKYNYDNLTDNYSNMIWWNNDNAKYITSSKEYPYLSWAYYHSANKNGEIFANSSLYPLSWEQNGSQAKYEKMSIIDNKFSDSKISPTHVWTASEMLLFILDDTGNLDI